VEELKVTYFGVEGIVFFGVGEVAFLFGSPDE
jgi:hypothetical protein